MEVESAIAGRSPNEQGWWRVQCPYCFDRKSSSDKHKSMAVSTRGFYSCWRCGKRGSIPPRTEFDIQAPPPLEDLPAGELPDEWCSLFAIRDHPPAKPLWDFIVDYLERGRNVKIKTVLELGAGFTQARRYGGVPRIVIPIVAAGKLLGWSARDLSNTHPAKYLNMPGMPRERILFCQDLVSAMPDDMPLVPVEGVFDALPHYPMTCATLGQPTNKQVDLFKRTDRPIVVASDADTGRYGEMLAWSLRMDGKQAFWLRLPPGQDPGKIKPVDFQQMVVDAMLGRG